MQSVTRKWFRAWMRPRRRIAAPFLTALLVTLGTSAIPAVASAAPILLTEFAFAYDREFVCVPCNFETLSYFDLTSYSRGSGGPTISLFGYLDGDGDPDAYGFPIPLGTAGDFLFDETNAPGFAGIAARLTDDINDGFIFSFPGVTANDRAGELAAFGRLLTDQTIEFIRFVVDERAVTTDTGLEYSLYADWQFWGHDADAPTPVNEPTTLALVLAGFVSLVAGRGAGRSRKRSRSLAPQSSR